MTVVWLINVAISNLSRANEKAEFGMRWFCQIDIVLAEIKI